MGFDVIHGAEREVKETKNALAAMHKLKSVTLWVSNEQDVSNNK